MPVLLALFPLGSEIRQFSHSGILAQLLDRGWTIAIVAKVVDDDLAHQLDKRIKVFPWPDDILPFRIREINALLDNACDLRLKRADKSSWKYVDQQSKNWKRYLLSSLEKIGGYALACHPIIYKFGLFLEQQLLAHHTSHNWRNLITSLNADVILVNVGRASTVPLALTEAKKLGVSTVILYHTWKDVVVAGGRLNHKFSAIGVWNEPMRQQLIFQNPTIDPANIHLVGCGHFSCVGREDLLLPREKMLSDLDLDPNKRIILFTASAPWVIPEEERYIKLINSWIEQGLLPNTQILVRTNPMDTDQILAHAIQKNYQHTRVMVADWRWDKNNNWCFQRKNDQLFYNSVLYHAVVNVSVPSTVTIECAIASLPVINIGFDLPGPQPLTGNIHSFWNADFYESVRLTKAAKLANSPEDLLALLQKAINKRNLLADQQEDFINLQLGVPPSQASSAAVKLIEKMI